MTGENLLDSKDSLGDQSMSFLWVLLSYLISDGIQAGVVTAYSLSAREAEVGGVWVKLAS